MWFRLFLVECLVEVVCSSAERSDKFEMDVEDVVSLLQVAALDDATPLATGGCGAAQEERAKALKPMVWMHVPKCGSSFVNTLYHNPTLCPYTPSDAWLPNLPSQLVDFYHDYPPDVCCPGAWSTTIPPSIYHPAVGGRYEESAGHIVTILRQPEQRIMSSFFWHQDLAASLNNSDISPPSPIEFAKRDQGCYVKKIVSDSSDRSDRCDQYPVPTRQQTSLATQRLREGFAFVGVHEEWDMSICLFHAMFGGACVPDELTDTRHGLHRTGHDSYDTTLLEGFVDVYDGEVYFEAVRLFEANLEHYRLTRASCASACLG